MDKIATVEQMRGLDRRTIGENGVAGLVLMENAGRGACAVIQEHFPELRRAAVFAGKGNNGGDGLVIARHLQNAGVEVMVLLLAGKDEIKGDARTNLEAWLKMKGKLEQIKSEKDLAGQRPAILHADLLVDAIFGTGLNAEVQGLYRAAIELINQVSSERNLPVLAVDIASGLNADTGQVMGVAVEADVTATFGLAKVGQLCFPGAALSGRIEVIDISIPPELFADLPYHAVTAAAAAELCARRPEDSHKGRNGHLLVLAGSPGKTGAAVMAGESALRSGAGLVTLGVPASLHDLFELKTLEVMTEPLPDTDRRTLGRAAVARAKELMADKEAVALGPGLGRGEEVTEFVRAVIAASSAPMVIDADGLNAVATDPEMVKARQAPIIVTPHPGEMSRLLKRPTAQVQADRLSAALEFAKSYGVITVLKGAHTVIATPEGQAFIVLSGNPGMATAGMGDVLTGVIGSLLGQGYDPGRAAVLGVYLHGRAGDLAAKDLGEVGLIASDLIQRLPRTLSELKVEV